MENHKYSLAKKGKSICPQCERRTFVLYIDSETSNSLHSTVGKCDRADNCGHHYSPKQYFADNNISFESKKEFAPRPQAKPIPKPAPSYIDTDIFKKSLQGYDDNNLIQYLCEVVGVEATNKAISRYSVGSSKHWDGSTVFWQIDIQGKVRTGKIMQYNSDTGKRIKEPFNKIGWVHTALKLQAFELSQCFFGEHLLRETKQPVAIVESEKTAIVASIYLPTFIWLACGGSEGLNIDKCKCLTGRTVVLFPDIGKFDKWNEKAQILQAYCSVSVSGLLEKNAGETERAGGYDLADYLLKFPLSKFVEPQPQQAHTAQVAIGNNPTAYIATNGTLYIPTPPCCRVTYTVYSSVEAYNKRSELPTFVPFQSVDIAGMKEVFINLKTLKI